MYTSFFVTLPLSLSLSLTQEGLDFVGKPEREPRRGGLIGSRGGPGFRSGRISPVFLQLPSLFLLPALLHDLPNMSRHAHLQCGDRATGPSPEG